MTSPGPEIRPAASSIPRRLAAWLHRHRRTRLGLLMASPVGWLVLIYLGSLAFLFANALFTRDAFSGATNYQPTLDNFTRLLGDPYPGITLRTLGMAIAVTITCALLALPIAFFMARIVPARFRSAMVV